MSMKYPTQHDELNPCLCGAGKPSICETVDGKLYWVKCHHWTGKKCGRSTKMHTSFNLAREEWNNLNKKKDDIFNDYLLFLNKPDR